MPDTTTVPPQAPFAPSLDAGSMDFSVPAQQGVNALAVDESQVTRYESWRELREPLKALGRQACLAIALRVAKRVGVLVQLRNTATEVAAAGFDVPHWAWYGRTAGGAEASAAEVVLASTVTRAASCAVDACSAATNAADGASCEFHHLVARDLHRVQKIAELAAAGGIPLTGWDDPRLGPLWPDGVPEWHRKAEQELRKLKDQLANRPDPFAPPVSEAKLGAIKDANFLSALHRRGELDRFSGSQVIAHRQQIVGHGHDLAAVRAEVATRLGVPEALLATTFVPAF